MVVIKLPICQDTYSTDQTNDVSQVSFLNGVMHDLNRQMIEYRPFFVGLCYNCYSPRYKSGLQCDLQRCSGCQLVSYCSRDCQKADRSRHKYVCKAFPVVKGKNVLYTKGLWKKHIAGLCERVSQIPHAKPIFHNPRVCRTCKEARQELLTDCACMCVSYCSKKCSNADKKHKNNCNNLLQILQVYSFDDSPLLLPDLRQITENYKFAPVYTWNDVMPYEYSLEFQWHARSDKKEAVILEDSLLKERLSYPMSLLYSLQSLPARQISIAGSPLEDLTTLDIHVVSSIPLYGSESWEVFMHHLPNLKQLNVVYVNQGKEFRQSFGAIMMSFGRCGDCEEGGRVINSSVHQMPYHMFFSSAQFTDPDVVVIFGNEHEMSTHEEGCIHNKISYRNMTHSRDTVLVLMDATKDRVIQGVRAVNAVQSVDELVSPQINPLRGFSSNLAEVGSDSFIINEKSYFACLRRR